MSKVYVGQDWQLTLDTNEDVSAATTKQIRVRKPDGSIENKAASVVDTTKLRITLTNTDIDQNGMWKFQTYAEVGGSVYFGETYEQEVFSKFK